MSVLHFKPGDHVTVLATDFSDTVANRVADQGGLPCYELLHSRGVYRHDALLYEGRPVPLALSVQMHIA